MLLNIFLLALVASPLVTAHGKVSVVTGDAGGNTTALGIKGAIVPGAGSNSKTEVDTTVFSSTKAKTNGLGRTTGGGANSLKGMAAVIAQSGSILPQVSITGGSVSGTLHIVTTDGAGPYTAIIDPTGTGKFATGHHGKVVTQVPGKNGNINANGTVRRLLAKMVLAKRAANVNKDFPFKVEVPPGIACNGTVAGQSNVCLMKFTNPSNAGPFGGVFAFQIVGKGNTTAALTACARAVAVEFKA